jgi:ABC-type transporter Mla subunit MlaD
MNNRKLNSGFLAKVQIKYLFLVALVSGVVFILIGGFSDKTYLSIILTISVMIAYFLVGQKIVERELLTNEQFADSNYYLGFLFTLISLASSLYILSNGSMEGGLLTRLIGQFGISISTTIVGLSLRIYLLSFSPNIGSNIESFNLMIMEKLQMLNDHIGHSIDQTKTFSNVIDDKIHLFIEQTLKSVEQYNERLIASLDQHSISNIFDKIYADMDTVHAKQEERVDEIYKNITNYHLRYEKQNQASTKAFQDSITDSEKWISEFNDSMGKSAGSIANSNTEMRKVIHNFDDFVRGLPKLFAEVNTLFEQSSKTLTADLEGKNRELIENFIEQKDMQNRILIERVLGENKKVIDSFISNGESQNSSVIKKLNSMNEEIVASFIQSRESGNEKIINDIMVLNNKVVQSVGSRAENTNAKVVDAIITSSTKVLHSFVNNQDQKNEQLIQKIALENKRLLDTMAKVLAESRPAVPAQQARPAAAPEQKEPVNEKMRSHGSVKLPKH